MILTLVHYFLSGRRECDISFTLCAQLRCGVLPLHIEMGRHRGVTEDERICEHYELNETESGIHFILSCPSYHDL